MNKEVEAYKLFRQLEAREKRANPYKFYDKDELIDEILKNEDEIERLNNIVNEFDKLLFGELQTYGGGGFVQEYYDKLQKLKEGNKK